MHPLILDSREPDKTHFMTSFRINHLNMFLNKLQELLGDCKDMCKELDWYEENFLLEDWEDTLGFVFITCQIFISSTIGDVLGKNNFTQKDKERILKNAPQFNGFRTKIELINAIANYYKHKEESNLSGDTLKILKGYNLLTKEFPITETLALIVEDNKLTSLWFYDG